MTLDYGNCRNDKGKRQNSPQSDDKNMLGNIGDMFVKCMRQVTKGHLLRVSDYYVMYRRRIDQFCETLAKITDWGTDPLRCNGSVTFCEKLVVRGREF